VEASYVDADNNYRQRATINLSKNSPFFDWTFPVIDDSAGVVTYSGSVNHKNGTTRDIPETVAKRNVISVPPPTAQFLEISVVPDLLDWSKVKLVNAALAYEDAPNSVRERIEMRFKSGDSEKKWRLPLKDVSKNSYSATTTYFMTDGTRKVVGPVTGTDLALFLEAPN
jgi:hypothetical protein